MSKLCDGCHQREVSKDDPGFGLCDTCKAHIRLREEAIERGDLADMERRSKEELAELTAIALARLTDEQRRELFGKYCWHCGCKQPWHPDVNEDRMACQCWNDE